MGLEKNGVFLLEHEGAVTWIIFNRPDQDNAFTEDMWEEFAELLTGLAKDPATKVVAIRGAGGNFSVGDAGYARSGTKVPPPDYERLGAVWDHDRLYGWMKRWSRVQELPKPVIAAVDGYCLNDAATLCSFCDLVVVADDAEIGRRSNIPLGGGYHIPVMSLHIGWKRGKQMEFCGGKRISGRTAADWGWANYAVASDQLVDNVRDLAQQVAQYPAEVLRIQKLACNRIAGLQAFSLSPLMGAQWDPILHFSRSVQRVRDRVREAGFAEASQSFNRGELDFD